MSPISFVVVGNSARRESATGSFLPPAQHPTTTLYARGLAPSDLLAIASAFLGESRRVRGDLAAWLRTSAPDHPSYAEGISDSLLDARTRRPSKRIKT